MNSVVKLVISAVFKARYHTCNAAVSICNLLFPNGRGGVTGPVLALPILKG